MNWVDMKSNYLIDQLGTENLHQLSEVGGDYNVHSLDPIYVINLVNRLMNSFDWTNYKPKP
jgi:hypothetical protein